MLSKLRLATLQANNSFRSLHHQHVLGVTPLAGVSPPVSTVQRPQQLSWVLEPSAALLDSTLLRSYSCCGGGSSKKNPPTAPQSKQSKNNPNKTTKDSKSSSSSSNKKKKQNPKK
ncbi:uncharacterized protein LOC124358728 [Homalodisca vitripennis]|uniref:uncharacterized protein LOC124358728 n=1 Tax=Homalodisca vitripennis TaxID=197043 RepID=UPI001EEAF9B8|nr:uncharacterized protein LOC124358728 [Homalodisca vitripennis]KAG8318008.1 hypothetical protein J6590_013144 [Homalodisca vitripennis]